MKQKEIATSDEICS